MESIYQNTERIGNFTSSEIVALTKNGKAKDSIGEPAFTYVEECNMERRLGRNLSSEAETRPIIWGKFIEKRVFDLLDFDYIHTSQTTLSHPTIPYWKGSPDFLNNDAVCDAKCPTSLESFCQLVDAYFEKDENGVYQMVHPALTIEAVRKNHKDGEKFYWQLVSNACIKGLKYAELIVYVPYRSELEIIREMAANYNGDQNKIAWINWASDDELPYLIEGGHYQNLNIIRFEVPQADKDFLTKRVIELSKFLEPWPETKLI
jgi:hypothetical protein